MPNTTQHIPDGRESRGNVFQNNFRCFYRLERAIVQVYQVQRGSRDALARILCIHGPKETKKNIYMHRFVQERVYNVIIAKSVSKEIGYVLALIKLTQFGLNHEGLPRDRLALSRELRCFRRDQHGANNE